MVVDHGARWRYAATLLDMRSASSTTARSYQAIAAAPMMIALSPVRSFTASIVTRVNAISYEGTQTQQYPQRDKRPQPEGWGRPGLSPKLAALSLPTVLRRR